MGLANAEVVNAPRGGVARRASGACDLVTARALAPLTVLVEYAAPLLREGGVARRVEGARDADEEADGARRRGGCSAWSVAEVRDGRARSPGAGDRHLYVSSKVAPDARRFPRRAGNGPANGRSEPLSPTG